MSCLRNSTSEVMQDSISFDIKETPFGISLSPSLSSSYSFFCCSHHSVTLEWCIKPFKLTVEWLILIRPSWGEPGMLSGLGHQQHSPLLNLRLTSDACSSFQIAQTIWPALHPKGRRSYAHYDVERVNSTTEPGITGLENYLPKRSKYMLFLWWNSERTNQ